MKSITKATLFFYVFFLTSICLNAQMSVSAKIDWKKLENSNINGAQSFDNASFDIEFPLSPKKCDQFQIGSSAASNYTVSISDLTYSEVTPQELEQVKRLPIESLPKLIKGFGQSRNGNILSVCFYPYVKDGGRFKKIESYRIVVVNASGITQETIGGSKVRKKATVTNSVLDADGWHKMNVKSTGMHKVTASFLSDNAIALNPVSISNVRIVGNGSAMLPERVGDYRPDDLIDVPVEVYDLNSDGLFNGSDYLLFFAKSPHSWSYNKLADEYAHKTNVYRDENSYFISVENGQGANAIQAPVVNDPATVSVSSFDDYQFVEDELENLVGTGRQWFGDAFDFTLSYSYSFNFPNIATQQPARVRVRAAGRESTGSTSIVTKLNGITPILSNVIHKLPSGDYAPFATISDNQAAFQSTTAGFSLVLEYQNSSNPTGVAWLDFIEIQVIRDLKYSSGMLYFRDGSISGVGEVAEYTISQAPSSLTVWDVTDLEDIKAVSGTSQNNEFKFKDHADTFKEYVAFSGSSFPEPTYKGVVAKQNLHGLPAAEMLIVVHPNFLSAANRLANYHVDVDNISTHVVTTDMVYNEFSSGGQDIAAIRDFAKLNYEKSKTAGTPFNYLLLFGDASYDYKDRINGNSNFVPVWESESSLSLEASSITDDFYGFLDSAEGSNGFNGQVLDIAVGRIPSASLAQAESFVDKIMAYSAKDTRFGDWRSNVLLMADDVDASWETTFVTSSEVFANRVSKSSKAFNIDKIYTDAYQQVVTTGSQTYPEASNDMFRKVQQGNLLTNYIGHGGEISLSSEGLLRLHHVNDWTNINTMPVFMTITCEFTRVDDPGRVSAGEQLCMNPNGGAIALISTTRVVQASPAIQLNSAVFNTFFERPDNEPKTIGAVVRDAKNDIFNNSTRLKFSLFGDPAVKLAIPYYNIDLLTVNGKPISGGNLDTLTALSKVNVTGQVSDFSNQKLSNFNGVVDVTVYDKASEKATKRNDGKGPVLPFKIQNNLLYRGKLEVTNGDFVFEFLVPKDISYQFGYGKFSLYATNNEVDAAGYNDTAIIGGINSNAVADNEGPEVLLYINDESFVRGGVTNEDPELFAILRDSSGINTVGNGIGHDLVAILDGKTDQSLNINQYYQADLNSYQSGTVRFPFYDLEEGEHTLKLRVFDVYNNDSEANTEFIVADSEGLALKRVLNYPNPFTTFTDFQFEHNRSNEPLEVQVQIFTVSGKLVKTINSLVVSEGNRVQSKVTWNGLDDYGDKIGRGVYVYRVKLRSQIDNSTADKYEKLVILR